MVVSLETVEFIDVGLFCFLEQVKLLLLASFEKLNELSAHLYFGVEDADWLSECSGIEEMVALLLIAVLLVLPIFNHKVVHHGFRY